jgi:hypothetical protein
MHPFERWPPSHRGRWLAALAAVYLVVQLAIASVNGPLSTDSAPNGIVSFELAGNAAKATRMVSEWRQAGAVDEAGFSLGFDFLYMPLYGMLLAALVIAVARRWARARTAGRFVAWGVFLAVAFDVVETASLTRVLDDPSNGGLAAVARACALSKFGLLVVALLFVVVVGATGLVLRSGREG